MGGDRGGGAVAEASVAGACGRRLKPGVTSNRRKRRKRQSARRRGGGGSGGSGGGVGVGVGGGVVRELWAAMSAVEAVREASRDCMKRVRRWLVRRVLPVAARSAA